MPSRNSSATPLSRLESLRQKHAVYKEQIKKLQQCPSAQEYCMQQMISGLKKQKLMIKEEIEGIRKAS